MEKTGHKKENCWSRNKTDIGARLLDKSNNERDTGGSIGYLMSDVEIDGEIFEIEKKKPENLFYPILLNDFIDTE